MNKKLLALLLGSTALATSISFDLLAAGTASVNDEMNQEHAQISHRNTLERLDDLDASLIAFAKENPSVVKNALKAEQEAEEVKNAATIPLVIVDKDGTKAINPLMNHYQRTLKEMNDLSYGIAKRQGFSDELNKWAVALNRNSTEFEQFKMQMEEDFGVGCCVDLFDILEEMDYQDRADHIRRQIATLEGKIQHHIAAEQSNYQKLADAGWELKVIEGKTGYKSQTGNERSYVPDDRGFVAFHAETNTIMRVFHGSRNDNDWDTNFDGTKIHASEAGLNLPGDALIHRGFGHAVASCLDQANQATLEFVAKVKDKSLLNVFDTGHSQGGGVATLAGIDAAVNLSKEIYGHDYDNSVGNHFKTYVYSAPPVIDEEYIDEVHVQVGLDNIAQQNVNHDLVPNAAKVIGGLYEWIESANKFKWLTKIPVVGAKLQSAINNGIEHFLAKPQFKTFLEKDLKEALQGFTGYRMVGHLVLDHSGDAMKRMAWPAFKSFAHRTGINFVDMLAGYWSDLTGGEKASPGITGFLKGVLIDGVTAAVAPLHYGSTTIDNTGAFHPDVLGSDINKMLAQGAVEANTKPTSHNTGFFSKVKSIFGFGH